MLKVSICPQFFHQNYTQVHLTYSFIDRRVNFKSRFMIFKTASPFPFQIQAELVLACAGLHNFLRKECRSDEFPIELEEDQASPHLDMEDENHELLSQSQLEQRAEANSWRASIANAMWEMRPRYNNDGNEEDDNEDEING
ncbi:hypothetical protein OROMI_017959 [Orobanche minor]